MTIHLTVVLHNLSQLSLVVELYSEYQSKLTNVCGHGSTFQKGDTNYPCPIPKFLYTIQNDEVPITFIT